MMIADNILQAIIKRVKDDNVLNINSASLSNYIPPDQSPPSIEIKIVAHSQAAGQKNSIAHADIKIISAYCGDQELQKLRASVVKQLTCQPFKDVEQRHVIQGRVMQQIRKSENNGRIQTEFLKLMFFIAPLN